MLNVSFHTIVVLKNTEVDYFFIIIHYFPLNIILSLKVSGKKILSLKMSGQYDIVIESEKLLFTINISFYYY